MRLFQDNKIYDLNEASSVLKVSKRTLERRVARGDNIRVSDSGNKEKIGGFEWALLVLVIVGIVLVSAF